MKICKSNIILTGISELGAWGVLGNFLDAPDHVLSVLSQQLRNFLTALFSSQNKVTILDTEVNLHSNTAIFVSLTTSM